jgi:pimeloyl-ACP methyl ester carboxylesterase
VGDIDIAYQIFGKGNPLLFIPMTMDMWEPMLNGLSENHTVILFDNRGIGQTTAAGNETTTTKSSVVVSVVIPSSKSII